MATCATIGIEASGKVVTGEYVRPATDLEVEEYFRKRAEKTCATSGGMQER